MSENATELKAQNEALIAEILNLSQAIEKARNEEAAQERRGALAAEVYTTLFTNTETWKGNTGMQIAYLLGGILTNGGIDLRPNSGMAKLLKASFPPGHAVHAFVTYI